MPWGFGNDNKANNANSPESEAGVIEVPELAPKSQSTADILGSIGEPDNGGTAQPGVIDLTSEENKPRRRGRPRKSDSPSADKGAPMALFSEDGIGKLWVNAWNGIFSVCDAPKLTPQEEKQQAEVFAHWCKSRFPNTSEKYQPDMLLAASLLFMVAPRVGPIAKTTAPWWKKLYAKMRGKKSEPSNNDS